MMCQSHLLPQGRAHARNPQEPLKRLARAAGQRDLRHAEGHPTGDDGEFPPGLSEPWSFCFWAQALWA